MALNGSGQIQIGIIPNNHGGAPPHSTTNGGYTAATVAPQPSTGGYASTTASPPLSTSNGGYTSTRAAPPHSTANGGYTSTTAAPPFSTANGGYTSATAAPPTFTANGGYTSTTASTPHSATNGGYTSATAAPPPSTANGGYKSTPVAPEPPSNAGKASDPAPKNETAPKAPEGHGGPSDDSNKPGMSHKFLSNTAKLGYFLPTGISTLFQTAVPKIYTNGQCSPIGRIMMWLLLALCVLICVLSQFTDSTSDSSEKEKVFTDSNDSSESVVPDSNDTSENANDGKKKVVYHFVKPWKLEPEELFEDGLHIIISMVAFLTIAFSDQRVVDCVLPAHVKDVEQVMLGLQVIVLSICSFLYVAFPVKRTGFVPKAEEKK